MTPVGAIAREERLSCLDTLRGFALLGILPASVVIFGMYFAAAHDLTVAVGTTGVNLVTWALVLILLTERGSVRHIGWPDHHRICGLTPSGGNISIHSTEEAR